MNKPKIGPVPDRIIFTKSNYESTPDLFKAIGTQLQLLIANGYAAVVLPAVNTDNSVAPAVAIEYASLQPNKPNAAIPIWVEPKEYETFMNLLNQLQEEDEATPEEDDDHLDA